MRKPEILYEDNAIIVCVKPDGMPAQGDKSMSQDLVSYLKTYLIEQAATTGNPLKEEPYLAIIHRLDRPVGGIMVFAKTPEAAADLSRQVQDGKMVKFYQAVLTGELPDFEGTFEDYMVKDSKANLSRVCSKDTPGAKKAILHFEVLDVLETDQGLYTYALIELETGRHHQIRCQMAHHGAAIYGDVKYNPLYLGKKKSSAKGVKAPGQIALIATRLEFNHPSTGEHLIFKTEPWGKAFEILDAEEF